MRLRWNFFVFPHDLQAISRVYFFSKNHPPLLLKREGRDFLFDEGRGSPFLHFWFKSFNFLAARLIRWPNSGFVAVPVFPGFLAFV